MELSRALHSRTGAVAVGATFLVALSSVGGAVAAGLVTSGDIKDETIRARDIRTDGVNSSEVANGSMHMRDLSPGTQRKIKYSVVRSVPAGKTIRGVVGADYHNTGAAGTADYGVDVSLPLKARNALGDEDVEVNTKNWVDGGPGQTAPTSGDTGNTTCTGTVNYPTAPAGKVCIYVSGADNAANVAGYSVLPGTAKSPYGFKLKWDIPTGPGDTFVDAVWAYTAP